MLAIESTNVSGYGDPTNDDARRMILEAVVDRKETSLRRLTYDRCKNVVLALFQEPQKRAIENIHIPIFEVMEQAPVKVFFTECAYM